MVTHENEYGMTAIPGQANGCDQAGCYTDNIKYNAEMAQMEALIDISEFCRQNITHNCTNNYLTGLAWWKDREGNIREYWDGAHDDDTQGCHCSLHGEGCNEDALGKSVRININFT